MAIVRRTPTVATCDSVYAALGIDSFAEAIADVAIVACAAYGAVGSLVEVNVGQVNRVRLDWPHISMDPLVQPRSAIAIFVMDVVQLAVAVVDDGGKHLPFAAAMGIDCLIQMKE